ncbi:MAG: hypothetical protein WCI27_10005 [Candidatus Omnitrophota bacterium]
MLNILSLLQPERSDYQPELTERVYSTADQVAYRSTYEDAKNYMVLTRYASGQYSINGASPEMIDRLGDTIDVRKKCKRL